MSGFSFIDSHAHLDYPQLAGDLAGVLARAEAAGISDIITIGVRPSTVDQPRQLAEKHANIWFSAGCHPHEAGKEAEACNTELFIRQAAHPKCVAIGECGLDYYYDYAPREQQAASFRAQIEAARQLDLPVIIHARDADADMIALIEEEYTAGPWRGLLHCFSSGQDLAWRALELGFYISFSGILTFNSAKELQALAAEVPADRVLVETDAPFLAPVPHRGASNEPAFARHTLEKLADLQGRDMAEMARLTAANTRALFHKMGEGA